MVDEVDCHLVGSKQARVDEGSRQFRWGAAHPYRRGVDHDCGSKHPFEVGHLAHLASDRSTPGSGHLVTGQDSQRCGASACHRSSDGSCRTSSAQQRHVGASEVQSKRTMQRCDEAFAIGRDADDLAILERQAVHGVEHLCVADDQIRRLRYLGLEWHRHRQTPDPLMAHRLDERRATTRPNVETL